MSRPSSPAASWARLAVSLASRFRAASSTVAACSRGTTTTPSSSATITSPGRTYTPAQTMGVWTFPGVSFTVPLAEIAFDQTGKPISVSVTTSRVPTSRTPPLTPCACRLVASRSPRYPSSHGLVGVTTRMSPGCACSTAMWIDQLSPGATSQVSALPATRTGRKIGRMSARSSPVRPWASCTVATPAFARPSTTARSVAQVPVVARARGGDHEDVAGLRLLDGNVDRPVVAWGDLAGQRVAGDAHRPEDRADVRPEQPRAALGLVHRRHPCLRQAVDDREIGSKGVLYN